MTTRLGLCKIFRWTRCSLYVHDVIAIIVTYMNDHWNEIGNSFRNKKQSNVYVRFISSTFVLHEPIDQIHFFFFYGLIRIIESFDTAHRKIWFSLPSLRERSLLRDSHSNTSKWCHVFLLNLSVTHRRVVDFSDDLSIFKYSSLHNLLFNDIFAIRNKWIDKKASWSK